MCGIAGIMRRDGAIPDSAMLDRLLGAMSHRGPDGDGRFVQSGLALMQNRLAIIDLVTGDQPFIDPDSGIVLVANGEIYNYLELRDQELAGVTHRTACDCETPLHLYRQRGLAFTEPLRGMFAMALFDPAQNRLVLARDFYGIKPLYYVATPELFAFASEAQALIAAGLVPGGPQLTPRIRDELLALQFTTGRDTIFAGIQRVLPGEVLVVEQAAITSRRVVPGLPAGAPRPIAQDKALARLDAILGEAVAQHSRSDVPYGLFLSGGVDSGLVLSYMAEGGKRVRSYTAGFDSSAVADERPEARRLADAVKADHSEVLFDEQDFWTLLPEIAAFLDDPVADYAILPSYKLAQIAVGELKVVLTGEGGDEMFAGYSRYRRAARPWWLGGRAPRRKSKMTKAGILRPELRNEDWRSELDATARATADPARTRLQAAQVVDCATWLPGDLLTKLDRCLMAHSLEGRTPFLDPIVADFALTLPDPLKVQGRHGKYLCRLLLERRLPAARPFAKKKGFNVPVGDWITRRGRDLGPLVAAQPSVRALCAPDDVIRLFANPGRTGRLAAWNLLFYALWHRRHIDGRRPAGDVFACLSATG